MYMYQIYQFIKIFGILIKNPTHEDVYIYEGIHGRFGRKK